MRQSPETRTGSETSNVLLLKPVLLFFFLIVVELHAQSPVTTFILVRHAEKEAGSSKDPELSEEGRKRASRLAEMLGETTLDAIYSTDFKRTRNTVGPLAQRMALEINSYVPMKASAIDEMKEKFPGGTIVICGHSNTIPWTANYLTGNNSVKDFEDSVYDNLLIVEVGDRGMTKVIWMKY